METSAEIIEQAKNRFKELEHKGFEWRSFYNGFLEGSLDKTEDKVKELINLYDQVLHGEGKLLGLLDCIDNYYNGCWDEESEKIEKLKQELKHSL